MNHNIMECLSKLFILFTCAPFVKISSLDNPVSSNSYNFLVIWTYIAFLSSSDKYFNAPLGLTWPSTNVLN